MVAVCLPNLKRPLSKHHEFNPAIVLLCLDTWSSNGGPSYSGWCPIFNYSNPGDLFLDQGRDLVIDKSGNQVYVSFGSGFFLYPYWFFKMAALPIEPISIRIFTLLIGLISIFLIFHIIRNCLTYENEQNDRLALIATFVFVFNPGFLWYFSNGYDHEIVTIPFFLAAVLAFQKIIQQKNLSFSAVFLLCFSLTGGIFCDWLNLFTAAFIFFYALFNVRQDKKWFVVLLLITATTVFSIAMSMYPFVKYLGWQSYFEMLMKRFSERSIASTDNGWFFQHLLKLIINYSTAYASLSLIIILIWLVNRMGIKRYLSSLSKTGRVSLLLFCIIPVLHHFLFLEFSGRHEYAVIKALPLLSIISALLIFQTKKSVQMPFTIFIFVISIAQYYYINKPGATSWKGDFYDVSQKTGLIVKQSAYPDEVVFVMDNDMYPQMNFYAKRSTVNAGSLAEAKQKLLQMPNSKKGVWFDVRNGKFFGMYRFRR
jgi:hypothetical protein